MEPRSNNGLHQFQGELKSVGFGQECLTSRMNVGVNDMNELAFISSLVWPLVMVSLLLVYRHPIQELLASFVGRIQHGDEVRIWSITIGRSAGKIKAPDIGGIVSDDHLALIHRSWRVPSRDKEFAGASMYQIDVIVFGEDAALDRVEYVVYHLDPSYPRPVQPGGSRDQKFELKELANGHSLIRADVKIKGQEEMVHLSRFIDLMEESPKLKGTYL